MPGTLVPAAGLLNLNALQSGVVRVVSVHVGQSVRVGQPLLEIDGSAASAALGSAATVEIVQLRAERLLAYGQAIRRAATRAALSLWRIGWELLRRG